MAFVQLKDSDRDGVGILRLERPPANAIDLDAARDLTAAVAALETSGFRAVVLTGSNTVFSAGVDTKLVPTYSADQQREMIRAVNRLVASLYACTLPVVAAINGHALGGGLIFSLCTDYRICTSAPCKLGLPEVRAGIPFPAAPLAVLRAELSPQAARVMALRSLPLDPQTALAWGVVDELQPPERLLPRAIEIAADLGGISRDVYGRTKLSLRAETLLRVRGAAEHDDDPTLERWLG